MNGYRTLIAAAVALLAQILKLAGYELGDEEVWTDTILTLLTVGGILCTMIFRVLATKKVGTSRSLT